MGLLDVALIAVDSLAVLIEDAATGSDDVTEEVIHARIGEVLTKKPRLKRNILLCEKLGLSVSEFLKTGLGIRPTSSA